VGTDVKARAGLWLLAATWFAGALLTLVNAFVTRSLTGQIMLAALTATFGAACLVVAVRVAAAALAASAPGRPQALGAIAMVCWGAQLLLQGTAFAGDLTGDQPIPPEVRAALPLLEAATNVVAAGMLAQVARATGGRATLFVVGGGLTIAACGGYVFLRSAKLYDAPLWLGIAILGATATALLGAGTAIVAVRARAY
jgi:hypothetical protein